MTSFSNDVDILKYEPMLFGELHLPWQVLVEGSGGTLSQTNFTAQDADFSGAGVSAGGVIYMKSGVLDGAFEIVSVASDTQLVVSVLRADSQQAPVAPPGGEEINWRISTFAPQANEVAFGLTAYFGIKPGEPASPYDVQDIIDTSVLKQASVFAVISGVYAMLAGKADNENFWSKSLYYQKLYASAKERVRLSLDTGSDGVSEITKIGASGRLVRD